MKSKKKYIVFFGIIILYLVLVFLLTGKDIMKKNFKNLYIMISPTTRWKYEKGNWTSAEDISEYGMRDFNVYIDNKKFGNYNLTYNDRFYLFDKDRVSQPFDGDMIALRGNLKTNIIPFKKERINSTQSFIQKILNEKKMKASNENIVAERVKIDINHDQKIEEIYTVSNVFNAEEGSDSFALIFIKVRNEVKYLYESIQSSDQTLEMCFPYIQNIIDIDQDKQYEIIAGCNYYSNNGTCHFLYDNEKNNHTLLKNC